MKERINKEWGKFIGSMDWNLYLTFHHYGKCNEKGNRGLMTSVFNKNKNLIETMFFVSERGMDFKNIHSHILIKSSSSECLIKRIRNLNYKCNIDVKQIDKGITTDEGILKVGYYVSKFVNMGVDFDLFIN